MSGRHHPQQLQPLYQRILAGGIAGIMGWLAIYPLGVYACMHVLNKDVTVTLCIDVHVNACF